MKIDSVTQYGKHQTIDINKDFIPSDCTDGNYGVALIFLKGNLAERTEKFEKIRILLFEKEG